MKNIAIFISGTGSNMMSVVQSIKNGKIKNANVSFILSSTEKAKGLIYAKENDIKTFVLDYKKLKKEEVINLMLGYLNENNIDLVVLAGFIKPIYGEVLDNFKGKFINIHPSLLPLFSGKGFYGLNVHSAVLNSGAKITGASVHYVDAGIDTGEIIIQETCDVYEDDTPEILQKRVLEIEHKILSNAVDKVLNFYN